MRTRRITFVAAMAAVIAVLLAAGWALLAPAPARPLASFSEHGVRVDISLEPRRLGAPLLVARFTPDAPSGHLYSIDLPRDGIDGVGRPTLLEIPPQPGLRALGPARADRSPLSQQLDGFSAPLPIYPDGPVTLRMPVEATGGPATLSISYMACSSEGYCLPPVSGHVVTVEFPVVAAHGCAGHHQRRALIDALLPGPAKEA
jgi:hypothetical protein